ncbi:MAG TPA: YqeG family HAD IIIA-type phosphatase [Clostridiales bacterium]|jgi:hypothetical protein|nr:YqeG family HAD IIIA-type phosphatase [Clostridiales bacterium]
MLRKLIPDCYVKTVTYYSADFFRSRGIRGVLFDIDNTLEPYANPTPSEKTRQYLQSLTDAGIQYGFVSNNHQKRVELFNEQLTAFACWKSGKPSGKALEKARIHFGLPKKNMALIGDQLLTDVWAAKRYGILALLVVPCCKKEAFYIKLKRIIEKPILLYYKVKYGGIAE